MTTITQLVSDHLRGFFEEAEPATAKLTFLGADPLTLLRFGPDGERVVSYATVGCSVAPMRDPSDFTPDPTAGPRAELVWPVRGGLDAVTRPLAMIAAAPAVEGLILQPGALLDFTSPLWEGARFTACVLLDAEVPDCPVPGQGLDDDVVKLLQPVPVTPNEIALARAKGVAELQAKWAEQGADLADPHRSPVV